MANQPFRLCKQVAVYLFGRAGVFSADPGAGQNPDGLGAILLFALLGAFFGLLAGLMLSQIIRYASFLMGRSLGGYCWAIYGALVGALIFAWYATIGDEQ